MIQHPSRRDFLRLTGASLVGATLFSKLGTRQAWADQLADDKLWKQCAGMTLNFISENTSPSSAIAADLKPFEDLTGIKLNLTQLQLGDVTQKVALDFGSQQGFWHVIYADPYQILAPYYQGFVDLNEFMSDSTLPQIPKGLEDFIPTQLAADGRFLDQKALYALPYDCPTLIWVYRKDLFEKHHAKMQEALGFDPTPSGQITWEQYYQIADWFNKNAKSDVPFGTGHQARQYDSLMADFTSVLLAYGGDYFANGQELGLIGTKEPGKCLVNSPEGIEATKFYKKLVGIAHPGSTSWDWDGVAKAFEAGQVAMMPEWHEYAAEFEHSKMKGKVGYSILPRGPKRSANLYGGTGNGINKYAKEKERRAAWLFLLWSTSPAVQLEDLKSKVGGGTPTRQSIYDLPEVQAAMEHDSDMPNMLGAKYALEAWKPENIGLRPKISSWNECDTVIFTEVSKMLTAGQSPENTCGAMQKQIDKINKVA
jgi:multiple sugar transport system substrate-binding protein